MSDDRLASLESDIREIRTVLGRAPNAATGDDGDGMLAVLARLAAAQRETSRKVAAIVTVAGVALEALRVLIPTPPAPILAPPARPAVVANQPQ